MKAGTHRIVLCGWLMIVSIALCCPIPANGTQTTLWTMSSFDEFRKGESESISLTGTGEILLAPQTESILTVSEQPLFVWALAKDSKGNLYAGTGEEGRIFKIAPDGSSSLFFDSPEIGIMSLTVDAADNVYAGSAPDGLIYKITPEGSQSTLFSTGEVYIWSLVIDTNNILYAGTGGEGKIFKIFQDGTGTVLYDSPQSHVMSLVYDVGGWLYAGTEGKGITYKVGLDGSIFALYDAKEEEIRTLTLDSQGNLYIVAISSEFFAQAQAPGQMESQEPRPKEKVSKTSSIYRISPDGTVRKIVELPETLIYTMIADANDQLLAGTDEKGRLYRIFPEDGTCHQVAMLETGSIVALLRDSEQRIYAGTGDKGAVYRLEPQMAEQGTYLSPAYDVKTIATWGKVFWRGTTNQVALLTRTGNTAIPDDTWSLWSEEFRNKEGMPISNPSARFIQWKAILTVSPETQESPTLEEVSVAYLPHNLPPEVRKIAVFSTPSNGQQQPNNAPTNSKPSPSQNSGPRPQKGEITPPKQIPPGYIAIIWDAHDANNERLEYTLSLRGEEETKWKILKEELEAPLYFLDTSTLPDGNYFIKITATDLPDNPPDKALTGEKVSERFALDNTAPEISIAFNQIQDSDGVLITVIAHDEFSRLYDAEYSLDGEEWTTIFPDDDVTDSRDEKYSISLPDLTPEEHLLVFRAIDMHHNVGVAKFVFSPAAQEEQQTEQKTQTQ